MTWHTRLLALVVAAVALDACAQTPAVTPRPTTWAQPQQVEGVANLF